MYLKSLELQGFKSFADRTVVQFDHDITAIVGPNGCGKSNISDAIRWVMGEMSVKELRGTKMEDVIFGGTQTRSALGFAEATLTLDNSDGAFRIDTPEVSVTRRYYRSGESEYYINRSSARLRDINELFMDTGLGKDGYSNIGQGKISEIVALKSTDRREVFEEAAGISKYRHRKEETERRLANTQENLLRIGDKISELELQVGPLREQAETAKQYLEYRGELRSYEVTVWLDTLGKLVATAKKTEEDYTSAAFILEQQHDELNRLYAQSEQYSLQLNQMTLQTEEKREVLSQDEEEIRRTESEIAVAEGDIRNREENLQRLQEEIAEQDKRSGGLQEQIAEQLARIEEIRAQIETLRAGLEHAAAESGETDRSAEALRSRETQLRARSALLLSSVSAKKAEIASIRTASGEALEREKALEADKASAETRLNEAQTQSHDCTRRLNTAKENAEAAENRIEGYLLRQKTRAERRETLQKSYVELDVRENTLKSKLHMYREMQREYEGFGKSVKVVMQETKRGSLKGVHCPVSELLRTDDRYTVAIETALGGRMQDIVVEDRNTSKAVLNMLKVSNAGRVTCWPLDSVKPRELREKNVEKARGFVGVAVDLVQYDKKYDALIRYLLGDIVIAENLDSASAMAKQFGSRFMIVSLDGQVMNKGGSMTGGSVVKTTGMLSRANAIARMEQELKELETEKTALSQELTEAVRAAEETAYQLETARGELRTAEDDILHLEGESKQFDVLIGALREQIDGFDAELLSIRDKTGAVEGRIRTLEGEIENEQQQADATDAQIAALGAEHEELDEKSAALNAKITDLKMQVAAGDAERETALQNVAALQALAEQLQGDHTQKDALVAQYSAEIAALRKKIAELTEKAETAKTALSDKREAYQAFLAERNAVEQQRTKAEREAQEKNKDILQMEREVARLEQKKLSASMEEKQIIDRLWDTYELTRATAQDVCIEIESLAAANRRIAELRRKISAFGTPNLGAIDEFARVNERYEYLSTQRDDVLHSKNELEEIVRTITTEMKEIFVREFTRIDECFRETFLEMFGGGRASLELEDPEDPLGCGIEIRVQPPGKQLKTITLLSGGEQAFVAIALYFAILKVRPSSFCLLDEIDAALDERNITLFTRYLRGLADKTQFIIITHRRGTMEVSDALYGVTMQEKGVSTILHLDLEQVEQQLGITE
ncbi:MAG: chromosome segregation protein SMC [Oscillospiraceae bacterium]|nr:chromosome segregation protein SMC [Oscillospiraceae bacterium]